jgi:hypothetical protein
MLQFTPVHWVLVAVILAMLVTAPHSAGRDASATLPSHPL